MDFPYVVAVCTEAVLFGAILVNVLAGMIREVRGKRKRNPMYKPSGGDVFAMILLFMWLCFQSWKAWGLIRTLL